MELAVITTGQLRSTKLEDGKKMINQYVLDCVVGKGVHGIVYKCHEHLDKNNIFAMKAVMRDNPRARRERKYKLLSQQNQAQRSEQVPDGLHTAELQIRKEIAIMKKCNHLHVVKLHEVIDDRKRDTIYMVIEYLGGGEVRFTNGNNKPILTVEQSRRIMRDAILGLEYLHHQGIIHRDIKPANLIWTYNHDRVKIADFGTSHFCYAQRLAAAKAGDITAASVQEEDDSMLLNDSELAKRAGSPSFLAPETVWEYTKGAECQPRPPVTKAIDVWALGVTLYCFLFGRTPFRPPGQQNPTEWAAYDCICNHDWRAGRTMGFDEVPTGGRHPDEKALEDGQLGPVVLHLLDHFLRKDIDQRITLEEVKENRWFLLDLPNPTNWLSVTSPKPIQVSCQEASVAMSAVRFRWSSLWTASRPSAAVTSTHTNANGHPADTTTTITSTTVISPSGTASSNVKAIGKSSGPGGMSLTQRFTALLTRSPSHASPSPNTPSSLSTSTYSSSFINLIRMRRSQNALNPSQKVKKVEDPGKGRVKSLPERLRRVKSDRGANAEQRRREKNMQEREFMKRKKATEPPSVRLQGKGKEKEKSSSVPVPIPSSSASPSSSPSQRRSRNEPTSSFGSNRFTELLSSLAHWRPGSRSDHTGSPLDSNRKDKDKDKQREKTFPLTSSRIHAEKVQTSRPSAIVSSMHELRNSDTLTALTPVTRVHQGAPSRSLSTAALPLLTSCSGSTSPPVLSPTFATAVMSSGVAEGMECSCLPGPGTSPSSASSSSFGNIISPRRISSWDQAAGGDPDSRDLDVCGGLDFDEEEDDGLSGINGERVRAYDYVRPGTNSDGAALINMRDEVDGYSDLESEDAGDRLDTIGSMTEDQASDEGSFESGGDPQADEDEVLVFSARRRGG